MPEMSQMNLESRKSFFFDSLKDILSILGMTTVKHIYHPITALILLIFVNADWFYHIFWRHYLNELNQLKKT